MQILSESFGYIDSGLLLEKNMSKYQSILHKIDIYNKNVKANLNEGRHYSTDIRYSLNEQKDIRDMFKLMREQLLISVLEESFKYTLNEGFWDSVKQGAQTIKDKAVAAYDKAKDWTNEKWMALIEKTCPKIKNAYKLLNDLINSAIQSAKQLAEKLFEFFGKIGDKLRDAAIWLGGFGENEIGTQDEQKLDMALEQSANESYMIKDNVNVLYEYVFSPKLNPLNESDEAEQPMSESEQAEAITAKMNDDEKGFFTLLIDYVKQHLKGGNTSEAFVDEYIKYCNTLNEGTANKLGAWLRNKCANNKILSGILLNSFNGKKAGFWKTLIISLIGSVVLMLMAQLAPIGVGFAFAYLIVGILWGLRGIIQLIAKRLVQLRPGEKLFQDKRFVISLVITFAAFFISTWSLAKNFMHQLGVARSVDAQKEIAQFVKEHNGQATPEEVQKFLDEHPNVMKSGMFTTTSGEAMSAEQIADSLKNFQTQVSDVMKGVPAAKWQSVIQDKVANGEITLPNHTTNLSLDIKYPGGLKAFYQTDKFKDFLNAHNMSWDEFQAVRFTMQSEVGGQATYAGLISGDNLPSGFTEDLTKLLAANGGSVVSLGAGQTAQAITKTFMKLAAVAAPAASAIAPFFAVFDFMGQDDGYIVASLGSEASQKRYYYVNKIEEKTLSEVAQEVEHTDSVQVALKQNDEVNQANSEALNDLDKKQLKNAVNQNEKAKAKIQLMLNNIKEQADSKNQKVALWYGIPISDKDLDTLSDSDPSKFEPWKNEHLKEEVPICFLNPNTLTGYDVEASDPKMRQNPWFFKGLQNKLTVKPLFNKDKNTKEYIGNMFKGLIEQGVKYFLTANSAGVALTDGLIKREDKKYVVADEAKANTPQVTMGYLTPSEICKVANGELNGFELTQADLAVDIIGKDENGNFKIKKRDETIEHEVEKDENGENAKIENYVKNYIIPVIANPDTDVYKEIMAYANSNKTFKELFVLDTPIKYTVESPEPEVQEASKYEQTREFETQLNIENIKKYEFWFRRSMSTYGQKVDQTTIGNFWLKIKNNFKSEENKYQPEDLANSWKDIAAMAHIIWKYKGSKIKWGNQLKEAGIKITKLQAQQAVKDEQRAKEDEQKSDEMLKKAEEMSNGSKPENTESKPEENNTEKPKDVASTDTRMDWFNKTIIRRITKKDNGKLKKLYKIFLSNDAIKTYYGLDDSGNIEKIQNDKLCAAILYSRFKSTKSPSEKYWPALTAKIKDKDENAEAHTNAIKAIYDICNQYRKKTDKKHSDWKKFIKENDVPQNNVSESLQNYKKFLKEDNTVKKEYTDETRLQERYNNVLGYNLQALHEWIKYNPLKY